MKVKGIHHISAIVRNPQENIDFYTSLLGLRMIKKAVNFDDANTYHFYFGNDNADLGTVITFFPWDNRAKEGVIGDGQLAITTYAIPVGSISFWKKRLEEFKVSYTIETRFNEEYISFKDKHGVINELHESNVGKQNTYEYNGITKEVAIRGFFGGVFYSKDYEATKSFFTSILGLKILKEDDNYVRFEMENSIGNTVDLLKRNFGEGRNSTGTVHHTAFGVDKDDLPKWKTLLESQGLRVSDIRNRDFFKALYFRAPGGMIIELSSEEPGFDPNLLDDKAQELYLPEHFEHLREELERNLTPVFVKPVKELKDYPYSNKQEYDAYTAHQELLNEINELAKTAKQRDLTDEELERRKVLRHRYIKNITSSVTDMVDNIRVEDESGEYQPLKKNNGDK